MSSSVSLNRRCGAITAKGEPCKARAIKGTDYCTAHSGTPSRRPGKTGARKGSKNRQAHRFYARSAKSRTRSRGAKSRPASCCGGEEQLETIDDVINDALDKQARLSAILDNTPDVDGEDLAKLLAIHGQNASRLGRLLRDKRALSGESADSLLHALGTALDEIATELGITL